MAKFCGACGAPVDSSMKFCSKCGAPIANKEINSQTGMVGTSGDAIQADLNHAQQEISQAAQKMGEFAGKFAGQAQQAFQGFQQNNCATATEGIGPNPPAMSFFSANDKIGWYRANVMHTNGRLNRLRFITYGLLNGLFSSVPWIVAAFIGSAIHSDILGYIVMFGLGFILSLPMTVAGYMLAIRRLHDLGQTGWWALITLIPYVGIILGLVLLLAPGTVGPNRYGQDPIAGQH